MAQFKTDFQLVSATKFNVAPVVIADESDYGTPVNAGTGDWMLGSTIPKGRRLLVVVDTGALSGTPTGLQVALYGSATDANGTSGAIISSTATEFATPAGDTTYTVEMPMSAISDASKYYSLGLALKGGGTTTCLAGAHAFVLDQHVKT
jgi:hypothetical protein